MRFIDFFAGIGGFRRGLELSGHECVGFCEFDKFATASYTSMHLLNEEQRKKLSEIPQRKRQKEILKEEYRNGEWYAKDIKSINAKDVPRAECWCFGAPCQDFSVAGRRAGLDGDRSSLVREIFRLLEEQEEQNRPEWLIYENVKGMLSSNRGLDYLSILSEMDRLGYDCEWQNINSKWYVPQNRERIYTIGHLRRYGRSKIFPVAGTDGENSVFQLGNYMKTKTRENPNQGRIYDADGISPCLNKMDGGGREPSIATKYFCDMNRGSGAKTTNVCRAIQSRYNKGISNRMGEISGVAIPVLTPDRVHEKQNGRIKENNDPMFTITAQDRHGVAVEPKLIGGIGEINFGKQFRQGNRVYSSDATAMCLNSQPVGNAGGYSYLYSIRRNEKKNQGDGIYIEMPGGFLAYCVWYEKYQCYIAIRKLTPKECFRLQGWSDEYFEKAAFVNTDNQLYKQAGNGVTVNVVEAIGKKIKEYENN